MAPEGSLATVVTSKNKYAKRYISMILGKVVMCDNYQDLKKHRTSITRECMKYQNHVASAKTVHFGDSLYWSSCSKNAVRSGTTEKP